MEFDRTTGTRYTMAAITGTMAAALAQDSVVWAMRAAPNPASGPKTLPIQVDGLYLAFTTIVAFTTAVTAGRRLGIYKGTVASPTGGAAIVPVAKRTNDAGADNGLEASPRISTTATLTVGSFVRAADPVGLLDLTAFGAAGARAEKYWPFLDSVEGPVILEPGELLVVSNPVAMDAAGTWQLLVEADYRRRG
jgi:hypothetical protein